MLSLLSLSELSVLHQKVLCELLMALEELTQVEGEGMELSLQSQAAGNGLPEPKGQYWETSRGRALSSQPCVWLTRFSRVRPDSAVS